LGEAPGSKVFTFLKLKTFPDTDRVGEKERDRVSSRLQELIDDLPEVDDEDYSGPNPFDTWTPQEIQAFGALHGWEDVVEFQGKIIEKRAALGERFLAGDDSAAYAFFFGRRASSLPPSSAPKRERKRPENPFRLARSANDGELLVESR
jgi:hypothetical protein